MSQGMEITVSKACIGTRMATAVDMSTLRPYRVGSQRIAFAVRRYEV